MSAKTVQVSTVYGPVDVELIYCDGPDCTSGGQAKYMVAWQRLEYQGIPAPTFGNANLPDGMDFCSLSCLEKAVSFMTGSANG